MNRSRRTAAGGALVLALALAAGGCGSSASSSAQKATVSPNGPEVNPAGDIPDNQAYVAYSPPGGGYSVKIPEGWSRTASAGAVTFTDKLNSVRMEQAPAAAAASVATAMRDDLPKLAASGRNFKPGTVTLVQRPAGQAVRITYLADSAPDAVTGRVATDAVERYVFFHKGQRVTLTVSGPKGADNVDPWKLVTSSVRWTR